MGHRARTLPKERILDALLPPARSATGDSRREDSSTRQLFAKRPALKAGLR